MNVELGTLLYLFKPQFCHHKYPSHNIKKCPFKKLLIQ
jgi:hypothetical protein